MKMPRIFIACFCGALIGGLIGLQFGYQLIGPIVGSLIGYLAYDLKGAWASGVRAWNIAFVENREKWKNDISEIFSVACLIFTGLCSIARSWIYATITASIVLPANIVAIALLWGGPDSFKTCDFQGCRASLAVLSLICLVATMSYCCSGKDGILKTFPNPIIGVWSCIRFEFGIVKSVVVNILVFIKVFFLLVHSNIRLLCACDAAFGAIIGYFCGNALVGALAGGVLGVINYEVVSVRLLKLTQASTVQV